MVFIFRMRAVAFSFLKNIGSSVRCDTILIPFSLDIRGSDLHPTSIKSRVCSPTALKRFLGVTLLFLVGWTVGAFGATVTFNTAPYWPASQDIISGWGPDVSSTIGETFIAPTGPSVTLNDFTFYCESYFPYGGVASLHLRAFVYQWSGSMTGHGGGATGEPIYMSPSSFTFSPPGRPTGWVPLTQNFGPSSVTLTPGGHYVMGFTLSTPSDYAASTGDIEAQLVPARNPTPFPPGVDGGGGAVWLNNSNNFALLNTTTWDTWGDVGDLSFTAHFTVVPEPSAVPLILTGAACAVSRFRRRRRP
jgi:hypothetical protein